MHDTTKSMRCQKDIGLGARRVPEGGLIAMTCSPFFFAQIIFSFVRKQGSRSRQRLLNLIHDGVEV
jgi:hypothetical protein